VTVFLRVLEASVDEKPEALLRAAAALHDLGKGSDAFQRAIFDREPKAFASVPGSPFAYWVSEEVRGVFERCHTFASNDRSALVGLQTSDDFRFVRLWWEVPPQRMGERWFVFAKGGAYSPFYADVYLVVTWEAGGYEIYAFNGIPFGTSGAPMRNPHHYFRPGLTWPLRTQIGFGIRAMPAGCIFGHKGPAAFSEGDAPDRLLALLAITTSAAFCYLVELQMAFGSYEVGVIQRTPVPDLSESDAAILARLARRAWSLKRSLDTTHETSHAFLLPPGPNEKVTGLDPVAVEREFAQIQREIDDHAFRLYGIRAEDRATIEASSKRGASEGEADETSDEEDDAPVGAAADALFSWLVGVAFGRFDPRLATGERAIPPESEPFDPLPSRSPGMWPEDEARDVLPPDILVDDSGHNEDLRQHVADAAEKTGWPDPSDLRQWLARDFFPLHLKVYSKSRRKAPIYWQLATPSASYAVWLYIHAFTQDTLFRVQNDYVVPKLALEERRLEATKRDGAGFTGEADPRPYEEQRLDLHRERSQADPPSARATSPAGKRKELAAQEAFVEELRAFLDEVKRVAPLWKPNLDDGVILHFAPLWRLVPQHKPWQKELKATWDALCAGTYDWAHLAMHLWPERVVPKCAADRSLAIAHGLEEVFWIEGSDGKWTARTTPTRPIDALVRERTSPAVKAALKSLLEAPVVSAGKKRKKGRGHA
jgi:hypothetical protein